MEQKKQKPKKQSLKGAFELTAKAVVVNDEGKVLLLKRSKKDWRFPEKWDLPGGGVENGEGVREAVRREILEETGLETEIGPVIHIFDFSKDSNPEENAAHELPGKGVRFLAFAGNEEVRLSEEHDGYSWKTPDEALEVLAQEGFEKDKYEAIKMSKEILEKEDAQGRWKRSIADFENYKKRQEESRKNLIAYANENLILDILPVVDNFHSSTEHIPGGQKDDSWVVGIMYIQKQLEKVLEDNGVKEISVETGDEFDPAVMEAIKQETVSNEQGTGKVKKIIQKGYKIGERVVRAARVIVE